MDNRCEKNKGGKIGSGADGVVMYYCRVPSNVQFTLTAKANAGINRDSWTKFFWLDGKR